MPKRILIADDHESVLRRLRAMIESQPGCEVCGDAVNGREAVAKAAELKPDLVILDFAMPQLDGLKAASAIKTLLPDVPVVMFTMYSSAVCQEFEKYGIARVIDKSNSATLGEAVQELLNEQEPSTSSSGPATAVPLAVVSANAPKL